MNFIALADRSEAESEKLLDDVDVSVNSVPSVLVFRVTVCSFVLHCCNVRETKVISYSSELFRLTVMSPPFVTGRSVIVLVLLFALAKVTVQIEPATLCSL